MIQTDIDTVVQKFTSESKPDQRFASFDYCYNYFRNTDDLTKDVEKSCLTLGFYLASWGMFRGSSFLLQKSARHFIPTIEYIAERPRGVWTIDVDTYTEDNIAQIEEIYRDVRDTLDLNRRAHRTLVTKVLLGVFGFVPAFDDYFTRTFREISGDRCRFRSVNRDSLAVIRDFYEANRTTVDRWSRETLTVDFLTGRPTRTNYPKAKIIDMYGFQRTFAKQAELSTESG